MTVILPAPATWGVTMRRIAVTPLLTLMLIGGQHARAAETAEVIALSCDGTIRPADSEDPRLPEPVTMILIVSLAEGTVTGFTAPREDWGSQIVAKISRADKRSVSFSGSSPSQK